VVRLVKTVRSHGSLRTILSSTLQFRQRISELTDCGTWTALFLNEPAFFYWHSLAALAHFLFLTTVEQRSRPRGAWTLPFVWASSQRPQLVFRVTVRAARLDWNWKWVPIQGRQRARYYSDFEFSAVPCPVACVLVPCPLRNTASRPQGSHWQVRHPDAPEKPLTLALTTSSLVLPIRTLEFDLETTIVPGKGELLSHIKANEKDVMSANLRQTGYFFAR
jgi:hypothetical protein